MGRKDFTKVLQAIDFSSLCPATVYDSDDEYEPQKNNNSNASYHQPFVAEILSNESNDL